MGAAFKVYSINPKQLDRLRDRFSLAGAKDDRLDAQVLAESVRLDRHLLREQQVFCSELVQLRDCSRLDAQLKQEKVRLINQMREVLWSYYPQFIELYRDLSHPWVLQLWKLASTPQKAKRLRISSVTRILKQHQIRCIDAVSVKKLLSEPSVKVTAGTTQGAVFQLESIIDRLRLVVRQLHRTRHEMQRLIKAYDQMLQEADEPEDKMRQRDVEILASIPGVGTVVLATLLAEVPDLLQQRDYKALRAYSGVAPVTKRSGKSHVVIRRRAVNTQLQNAMYHWARIACQHDAVSKTKYAALRDKGHRHARALRGVADRLLKVACTMLENQEIFDPDYPTFKLAA